MLGIMIVEKRIRGIENEIRKTAGMLAQIIDRRSIISLAWGENDSEVYDLDEWTIFLLDLLEDLESDYEHYSRELAILQREQAWDEYYQKLGDAICGVA